ncbi:hypothetical protein [Rubripirellula tenax]|uniref:hypothetical protein n=1 Tax=Rubripirellula tenax TaxID=2528015 RepID=UPI0011B6AC8F|nr:hypothetical protein [Rubripirellula tenax]
MSNDPFARFESSRSGLLIPVALFLIGAAGTTVAIGTLHRVESAAEPAKEKVIEVDPSESVLPVEPSSTAE